MASTLRIAVVGAGLGGLAAAIALRRQGFEVRIYEQAPELAEFGAGINISPNSAKVFRALELVEKLHAIERQDARISTFRRARNGTPPLDRPGGREELPRVDMRAAPRAHVLVEVDDLRAYECHP